MSEDLFPIESRWCAETGSYAPHIGIKCRECGKKEWRRSARKGLGHRIFHNEGWLLGSRRSTDVCPDCREARKSKSRRTKEMTPREKKAAWAQIEARLTAELDKAKQEGLLEDTGHEPPPPFNTQLAEQLAKVGSENAERVLGGLAEVVEIAEGKADPPLVVGVGPNGYRITALRRKPHQGWRNSGFLHKASAFKAGQVALSKELGRLATAPEDFITTKDEDGTWRWRRVIKKEEEAMAEGFSDTGPSVVAEPPKMPTAADNRKVLDALTVQYDEDAQRYRGAWTDSKVAATLDVPRAWVTAVREQFFGPERNEEQDVKTKEIREAIQMARNAVETLTQMAITAEGIAGKLAELEAKINGGK